MPLVDVANSIRNLPNPEPLININITKQRKRRHCSNCKEPSNICPGHNDATKCVKKRREIAATNLYQPMQMIPSMFNNFEHLIADTYSFPVDYVPYVQPMNVPPRFQQPFPTYTQSANQQMFQHYHASPFDRQFNFNMNHYPYNFW